MIWAYSAKITHNSLFDVSACLNATAIQALFDNIAMKRTNNGPPSGTINKLQTQSNINDSKNEMVCLGWKKLLLVCMLFEFCNFQQAFKTSRADSCTSGIVVCLEICKWDEYFTIKSSILINF